MNGRERVLVTLSHSDPDRVPTCDSFRDDTIARWPAEGPPAGVTPKVSFERYCFVMDCVRRYGPYG